MASLIAEPVSGVSDASAMQSLRENVACLRAKGDTVGELMAWAKYRWLVSGKQYPDDVATSAMIADACR